MDMTKLLEVKKAWTLYNLIDELQERLWERYEADFMAFMKEDYNACLKIKSAKK